jgi:hypothetical protein
MNHPASGPELLAMMEEFPAIYAKLHAEVLKHDEASTQIYARLGNRFTQDPELIDLADQVIVDLIDEANACLVPLQRMLAERNQQAEATSDALNRVGAGMAPSIAKLGELEYQASLASARSLVDTGIGLKRAPISLNENAIRRHYRSWHKYATGLAGHITDPEWRAYADAKIQGYEATTWMSIYVGLCRYRLELWRRPAARQGALCTGAEGAGGSGPAAPALAMLGSAAEGFR